MADTDGKENVAGHAGHFVESPFRFCLHCRVAYDFRTTSDFGKLTSLGTEGRSTATTILSLATIRHLRKEQTLDPRARKLLSFTDNVARHLVELRLKSCTVTVFGPVCFDAHLMQAFKTIGSRVTICVVVASGNDADGRSGVFQPRLVGAMRAAMVMDLVNVDMPNVRPDAGFNIRILVGVVTTEITTNFRSEAVVAHQRRQTQVVFVARRHPVAVHGLHCDEYRVTAALVEFDRGTGNGSCSMRFDSFNICRIGRTGIGLATVVCFMLKRELL